jgi:Holliday junction resolvasome RuvABC endonuclease subunit
MILGIDVGTQLLGFTVIDAQEKIIHNECIDLTSKKNISIFKKAAVVKERFIQIKNLYNIKNVFIEQSLNAFRPGSSSANVIVTISKFNGIVSWLCAEIFQTEPEYIGASTARKALGIKVEKGQNAKEIVLAHILGLESTFKVEYTAHNNPKKGTYDRADSYVIAKAGFFQCQKQKKSKS